MLIKCPECGHQVSDKAPLCPNCGIEIAGKVSSQSPDSGAAKTEDDTAGPVVTVMPMEEEEEVIATPIIESPKDDDGSSEDGGDGEDGSGKQGGGHSTLIVSLLIAAIICGVGLYFYKDAVDRMNAESKTPQTVAVTDSTETPVETETETEIPAVRDTIPAATATEEPPVEPEEDAETDAEDGKKAGSAVTEEERSKAAAGVRRFLRAINSHDKDALTASVSSFLTSFNGKSSATKYDVLQYMVDLYQADVKNLNWRIDNIESVEKRESSEGKPEYAVTVKATKETEREGGTSKHKFNIKAVVDSDGKISAANITREP